MSLSVCRLTQAAPQRVSGGLPLTTGHAHVPFWQVATAGQAFPQRPTPQLELSVRGLTQTFEHSAPPLGQPHVLLLHDSVATQGFVHEPQWFGSFDRVLHVPLQLVSPPGHPLTHEAGPASDCPHTGVVPAQVTPQAPQLDADAKVIVQPVPASAQSP